MNRFAAALARFGPVVLTIIIWCVAGVSPADGPVPPAAVASPLSPEESLAHFQLDEGLSIELAAAEPEIVDPVDIRFDEDGRMWAVEMRDYPSGPAPGETPLSRIRVLEDQDGDGRFETSHVFADGLLFATGLQPWRGGVIVTLAGRVAWLKDTDGDGRADVDETWYTGFAEENPQLRANHPRFALDNHVYVANGLRGGTVRNVRDPQAEAVPISSMDFRFDPLTGACEAVSGAGQFGLTFDDFGNRFVCSNRNPLRHIVLEDRYLKLNPYLAVPAVAEDVVAAGEASHVYPLSRAWTTSNLHAGQFTAACGIEIYRGDALGEAYYGNAFTCEPTGNLVHRELLSPQGVTFIGRPASEGREFLATPDEWFRPVNLHVGPDGALYVVDMYRAVIEHPEWVPDELKHRPDERFGDDRGRVYRIFRKDTDVHRERPNLSAASNADLVALLDHPNAWHRETAQRLLYERQDKSVGTALEELSRDARTPTGRVAALWTLQGLALLSSEVVRKALHDPEPRVREQAVVLAEPWLKSTPELVPMVIRLATASDRRLRFQTALTLGTQGGVGIDRPLCDIALAGADDVWTRRAVAAAIGSRAAGLFAEVVSEAERGREGSHSDKLDLIGELATLVGSRNQPSEAVNALQAILPHRPPEGSPFARIRQAAFLGLARSLARRGSDWSAVPADDEGYRQSLAAEVERFVFEPALAAAKDVNLGDQERLEAIDVLTFAPLDKGGDTLFALAEGDPSQSAQVRAIAALAAHDDPRIGPRLLQGFAARTPVVRRAILDAVLDGGPRVALLLDEIAAGRIAPTELDRVHADRLLAHKNPQIAARAKQLLAAILPADRQQALADYQPALALAADPARGRDVFQKNCTTCHRVAEIGVDVAPDISDTRTKTREQLLADILQPNRAIDANYLSYAVVTTDGRSFTGVISAETATSVTLRLPENKTETLLRQDIDELRSTGRSLMPDGLEKNIPPQAMADLISFLKNWRYLDGAVPVGTGVR